MPLMERRKKATLPKPVIFFADPWYQIINVATNVLNNNETILV
jgi:hypothetical protein